MRFDTNINPPDNEFSRFLANLDKRISALERPRLPYIGDWQEITEPVSVYSTISMQESTIEFDNTEYDATNRIGVGDKIRIKLEGNPDYYYFYAGKFETTRRIRLLINGAFSLTSDPIEEFAVSKLASPLDFPLAFGLSAGNYSINGGASLGSVIEDLQYYMIGDIIVIQGTIFANVTGSTIGTNQVVRTIPQFPLPTSWQLGGNRVVYMVNGGSYPTGITRFQTAPTRIFMERQDQAQIPDGTFACQVDVIWKPFYFNP